MQVRAAFLSGPERVDLGGVDLAAPEPGATVIDVAACGVCASNLQSWRHPELVIDRSGTTAGAVGHEIAGHVAIADTDCLAREGSLVCVEPNLATACGSCAACEAGTAWFCRTRRPLPVWGFTERMVVPAKALFAVPGNVPASVATLTEPLACGVHAVRGSWTAMRGGGRLEGVAVAVVGAGVAGLLAVAAARHLGAQRIVVMARYPQQAEQARALGADEVVTSDDANGLRAARPQLVIEAVGGSADTLRVAAESAAPTGEVAVLGLFDEPQAIEVRKAVFRELRMFFPVTYGISDGVHDFTVALEILGAAPERFAGLISHTFGLFDIGAAFAAAADKRSGALRVVVAPERPHRGQAGSDGIPGQPVQPNVC